MKYKSISSRNDIQKALNERKVAILASTKLNLSGLERTADSLTQIKNEPETFIKSYFGELKKSIDAKAQEAHAKIDQDHDRMIAKLQRYEDLGLSQLNRSHLDSEVPKINNIVAKFHESVSEWSSSLSQPNLTENEIEHTRVDAENFGKLVQAELNKLKLIVFGKKVYELHTVDKEAVKFGELVSYDAKDLLDENSAFNHQHQGSTLRPVNKLIRFDIKGTKRK